MRITIPTTQINGLYRPDLPEGMMSTKREYSADYTTVTVTLPDTPEVERWAVEQGHYVPENITPRQARLVLLQFGLLDQIEDAIEAIEDSTERRAARIQWEFASKINRNNALLRAFADQLGWSEEQIDQLMIQGYLIDE